MNEINNNRTKEEVMEVDFNALFQAKAKAAKLAQSQRPSKKFGQSNKEIYAEIYSKPEDVPEEIQRQVEELEANPVTAPFVELAKANGTDIAAALTPDPKKDGMKRPRLTKKRPTKKGVVATKKEVIRINGKDVEVDVKVLPPGNEYFVGKNPPSGKAPWGTKDDEEAAEARAERKLKGYVDRRMEAAAEAESKGRMRKGGGFQEWAELQARIEDGVEG